MGLNRLLPEYLSIDVALPDLSFFILRRLEGKTPITVSCLARLDKPEGFFATNILQIPGVNSNCFLSPDRMYFSRYAANNLNAGKLPENIAGPVPHYSCNSLPINTLNFFS
jgi:hypothetical protein